MRCARDVRRVALPWRGGPDTAIEPERARRRRARFRLQRAHLRRGAQLTLSTALPALGIELCSSYLGHPDADESIASHLQLGPDLSPQTWVETHVARELPVSAERRRCLLDHVLCLQQLLESATGGEVTVELADDALELVDVA